MPNCFVQKRSGLCAKLYVLVSVIIASSAIASDFENSRTRRTPLLTEGAPPRVQSTFTRYGRKPAAAAAAAVAAADKKLGDFDLDLNDPHLAGADLDDLDLEKEDEEDSALFRKTKDILDGKVLADEGDHEKPLSFKDLGPITKDIGLSDEDLNDLDDIDSGKVTVKKLGSSYNRNLDERPRDARPPPGMVAYPRQKKKVTEDFDLDQETDLGEETEVVKPPTPNEPSPAMANSTKGSDDDSTSQLVKENAAYEKRVAILTRKLDTALREVDYAKKEYGDARGEIAALKHQHERSKDAFKHSLASAHQEEKSGREEMAATIKEQKRAFEELFEEKQLLSQMLSDEQKTLKELQEKIQHPDLGLWVRQRAERAAILVETPETDAVKYYAKKYMAPKVTKMRHRLELLEKRVERTVDHLLPARYGSVVALLLSLGLVGFPIIVTMSTVVSVTKSVSLRQYVLLGNVFLTAFAAGLCIAGIILRQDPLQTLYEASETLFITLQLTTAVGFPIFLGLIGCTVVRSRDGLDAFVFGCEFVFYSLVAMNYRSRVWRPAMLGQNIETSVMMYAIYLMDFMSMTALTISSARIEEASVERDVDPEEGLGRKAVGITGSAPLQASVSSRVSSLSSGLIHAAMGHGRTGKEE